MALEIRYEGGRYHLSVGPPDASESHTATVETPTEAMATLSTWGCHSTDITNALDATGHDWRPEHDDEVVRRRQEEGGA